jgi:hypothetical protein
VPTSRETLRYVVKTKKHFMNEEVSRIPPRELDDKEDSGERDVSEERLGEILVYAFEWQPDAHIYVSPQGFGSSPSRSPATLTSTEYQWEGLLYPDAGKREPSEGVRAYNVHSDLAVLATNFAFNYRTHPASAERGESVRYRLTFSIPRGRLEEIRSRLHHASHVRLLSDEERELFMRSFQDANAKARQAAEKV